MKLIFHIWKTWNYTVDFSSNKTDSKLSRWFLFCHNFQRNPVFIGDISRIVNFIINFSNLFYLKSLFILSIHDYYNLYSEYMHSVLCPSVFFAVFSLIKMWLLAVLMSVIFSQGSKEIEDFASIPNLFHKIYIYICKSTSSILM